MKKEEIPFEVITGSETFISSIRAMLPITTRGTLNFTKNGLSIKESNEGKYATVNFFMSKEAFEKYQVEKEVKLRVNLEDFYKILKRTISYSRSARITIDKNRIRIEQIHKNNKKRQVEKIFTLPLYEEDENSLDVDEIEKALEKRIDVEIPLDKNDFKSGLNDIAFLLGSGRRSYGIDTNGEVEILAEKDRVVLRTWNRYNQVATTIPRANTTPNKDLQAMAEKDFEAKAIYEFGVLNQMLQLGRNSFTQEFLFRMGNSNPLQLVFKNPNKITLKLTLANREISDMQNQYFEDYDEIEFE